jgi:hypothetical protein
MPLLQTNDFKNAMKRARNLAINLPSGEIQIKEQDEIIDMLENMRDRKRSVNVDLFVLCS